MTYYFSVVNGYLECTNSRKTIISDYVNFHTAHFTLDSSWNGYSKTATFINQKSGVSTNIVLGVESVDCIIPWESLEANVDGGYFIVGLSGYKDSSVIRTKMMNPMLIEKSDVNNGNDPISPTPDEYEQIMDLISSMGGTYTLPTASTTTLGGVKIDDSTIKINSGVISSPSEIDDLDSSLLKTYSSSKILDILQSYQHKEYPIKLYGTKLNATNVTLFDTPPIVNATNYIETTSTNNTTIDWVNGTNTTFTRTSTSAVKLKRGDMVDFNIYTAFNRDCSVEYGAISYINGVPISTQQTFGNQDFSGVTGFTTVQVLKYELELDLLPITPTEYPIGTVFTTKLFKRQESATPTLTTRYMYGVNINNLDRFSYAKIQTNL